MSIGEPPVLVAAAAIANAVQDAVGVRIYDLPITAEKVLRALKEACGFGNLTAKSAKNAKRITDHSGPGVNPPCALRVQLRRMVFPANSDYQL